MDSVRERGMGKEEGVVKRAMVKFRKNKCTLAYKDIVEVFKHARKDERGKGIHTSRR